MLTHFLKVLMLRHVLYVVVCFEVGLRRLLQRQLHINQLTLQPPEKQTEFEFDVDVDIVSAIRKRAVGFNSGSHHGPTANFE